MRCTDRLSYCSRWCSLILPLRAVSLPGGETFASEAEKSASVYGNNSSPSLVAHNFLDQRSLRTSLLGKRYNCYAVNVLSSFERGRIE